MLILYNMIGTHSIQACRIGLKSIKELYEIRRTNVFLLKNSLEI
jgi:hypothetical protein